MAAKTKLNPLNGMHTAGIFSDMSIDGPIIGTLVVIVDRAKNLPNRKTIGKQDPYCAARLGKEAQKTTTDVRGGQTPKWDQELRFPVHDSPDYYQLKLSVFNDDKKTELIGETWIDLRDIILPGGGQSDQWQSLNCKGKYAGEIRIEITYYDNRPKPEKPVAKAKPVASGPDVDGANSNTRTPVKRRPLPSNPGSTEPSPAVKARAEPIQTPPRVQPHPHGSFIPTQSPLQAMEYNTPPPGRFNPADQYHMTEHGSRHTTPITRRDDSPYRRSVDRNDKFSAVEEDHRPSLEQYSRSYEHDHRSPHNVSQPANDPNLPAVLGPRQLGAAAQIDERPPPPPAHRIRNNSATSYEMNVAAPHKVTPTMPMRHDVLRHEAHRHSVQAAPPPTSSYPGRPVYRPYDSAPEMSKQLTYEDPNHTSPPRHHSYDSSYESQPHPRSMQPTVEDVPESWTPPVARSRGPSFQHEQQYDEMGFGSVPSPAPLNLSGRGSATSGHYTTPSPVQRPYVTNNLTTSPSPVSPRDHYDERPEGPHINSYNPLADPYSDIGNVSEGALVHHSSNYGMVPVPPTLVPGMDPQLSQEITMRIHEDRRQERRYTQPDSMVAPTRGRQYSEPPASYSVQPLSHGHHHRESRGYGAAYSNRSTTPSGSAHNTDMRRHSPSPNPNHNIRRKSVSPAPPQEDRRVSGIPFGPDSYDELNPSIVSAKEEVKNSEYTNAYGKIVTADGREVDPSDHLPMDTWAPEPEPKQPIKPEPLANSRSSLAGVQQMPPSGRRQIRISTRPQSMAILPSTYITPDVEPSMAPSSVRNRLQKKNHRVSALPAPAPNSNPLGPATSGQRNSTPPTALVRAGTFDYENYGPPYGVPRGAYVAAPPVPAKIPLMSGGLGPTTGGGHDDWALMDEMSRIDIGTGRSRRHGGY